MVISWAASTSCVPLRCEPEGPVKQFVASLLMVILPLLALAAWLFRSRLGFLKARMALAIKVGGIGYLIILAVQLATSEVSDEQLLVASVSFLAFGAVWVVAWLITRAVQKSR